MLSLDRCRALLVAGAATAVFSGCDDPTAIDAQFNNLERRGIVYAMNGTPISLPAAVAIRSGLAVAVDANFAFDIAFDLDSTGAVKVLTQARVASQLVSVHRVGLHVSDLPFAEVLSAPNSGFTYDSLTTLPMGKTLVVDVIEGSCGFGSFLGPNIYAKITIDSVVPATRAIYMHVMANPNCGFRSLIAGKPKD
jgi:hypothetical protein